MTLDARGSGSDLQRRHSVNKQRGRGEIAPGLFKNDRTMLDRPRYTTR